MRTRRTRPPPRSASQAADPRGALPCPLTHAEPPSVADAGAAQHSSCFDGHVSYDACLVLPEKGGFGVHPLPECRSGAIHAS